MGLTERKEDQKVLPLIGEGIFMLDGSLSLEADGTGVILITA